MDEQTVTKGRVWWCVEARQHPGAVSGHPTWGRLTIYKRSGQRLAIKNALAALDLPHLESVVIKVKRSAESPHGKETRTR